MTREHSHREALGEQADRLVFERRRGRDADVELNLCGADALDEALEHGPSSQREQHFPRQTAGTGPRLHHHQDLHARAPRVTLAGRGRDNTLRQTRAMFWAAERF